jgi:hypothetical protein
MSTVSSLTSLSSEEEEIPCQVAPVNQYREDLRIAQVSEPGENYYNHA